MRSWHALAAGCTLALAMAPSCLDATEIDAQVSTDVDCAVVAANGVDLHVGSPSTVDTPSSQLFGARSCTARAGTDNWVGDIVALPSGVDEAVAITAVLGVDKATDQCNLAQPDGCIVARRLLGYIKHKSLRLPIELRSDCKGVFCPSGQTCVHGACKGATVDTNSCNGAVCDEGSLVTDGGVDASCSADLTSDPKNCGKCGFDCSGGQCIGGVCNLLPQSFPILQLTGGACIAVASSGVFYTTGAISMPNVYQVPLNGGTPQPVAGNTVAGGTFGIASDGLRVFYANATQIVQVGTGPIMQWATNATLSSVATDGTNLCMQSYGGILATNCFAISNPTATSTFVHNSGTPGKVAMAGGVVYSSWSDGIVQQDPVQGSGSSTIPGLPAPDGIAIATPGSAIFVGTAAGVYSITQGDAGTSNTIVPGSARGLAYDTKTQTLFIANTGKSEIESWQSGQIGVLASNQQGLDCITFDAQAVYWLAGGVPRKVAR